LEPDDLMLRLELLNSEDGRYKPQAYLFVMDALEFTMARLGRRGHVSGRELLEGIAVLAKREFGPTAKIVLESWGVRQTLDVGEIVFSLVEAGLLGKTEEDSLQDFADIYDFDEVFEKRYDWGVSGQA
jgi:uncharacterized repeat protein (TIGR04138 family)